MFENRKDAGEQVAETLEERGIESDIVLAIPRGGLPLGREVADALGVPLDIVVSKKIGAPHNPELAIGAVASDSTVWRNDNPIEELGVDDEYIREESGRVAEMAHEKLRKYRGEESGPELEGKKVIIVDDGVATGATAIACIRQVKEAGAAKTVLAVPVGSPGKIDVLREEADEVIVLETPVRFGSVGQYYRTFGQVSDEEAMEYLKNDEG